MNLQYREILRSYIGYASSLESAYWKLYVVHPPAQRRLGYTLDKAVGEVAASDGRTYPQRNV